MTMLLAALLVASDPAVAAQQPQAPIAPAPSAKPQKEKKICKVDPDRIGSRLTARLCLTEREWQLKDQGVNLGARAGGSSVAEPHR